MINLYDYVGGDPVNWIDPDGEFVQYIIAGATIVAAVITGVNVMDDLTGNSSEANSIYEDIYQLENKPNPTKEDYVQKV